MEQMLKGVGAAPGLSIGKAVWWTKEQPEVTAVSIENVDQEMERFQAAVAKTREQIGKLRELAVAKMGETEAAVFDAHAAFLSDPAFVGEMENRIRSQKQNAESICQAVTDETSGIFAMLEDEYMQARADDIRDVGSRLLLNLLGKTPFDPSLLTAGSVVVAEELTPSDTAQFPEGIAGMVTAKGSKTAHAAIMARTLGIPAVLGLGKEIEKISEGADMIVDGAKGEILLHPSEEKLTNTKVAIEKQQSTLAQALEEAKEDAVTGNGERIQVLANIGSPADVATAKGKYSEGVGLFRTEFLYQENTHWPTEDEQYDAYKQVLEAFTGRPVVIRTLDIGGDKDLPYAELPKEENPFLGHRAIRYCLANPDMFKTQLRALLRASIYGELWIMFPMIGSVSEVRAAKALLDEARQELTAKGISFSADVKVGIMVEIPAAAITADLIAPEVDFMSIGTNDLTQYTLAADRGNELVAPLYDAAHPAVLRLVKMTADAAAKNNIMVGMCGELAGDAEMTEILLGLGLKELSMSAGAVPEVKQAVRKVNMDDARKLADKAIHQISGDDVRKLL